jgi:hypothetical protein
MLQIRLIRIQTLAEDPEELFIQDLHSIQNPDQLNQCSRFGSLFFGPQRSGSVIICMNPDPV